MRLGVVDQTLHALRDRTWGFTISRTIFTPESDIQWPIFLAKLEAYVNYSIDNDIRSKQFTASKNEQPLDPTQNVEVKKRFINNIIEDRELGCQY